MDESNAVQIHLHQKKLLLPWKTKAKSAALLYISYFYVLQCAETKKYAKIKECLPVLVEIWKKYNYRCSLLRYIQLKCLSEEKKAWPSQSCFEDLILQTKHMAMTSLPHCLMQLVTIFFVFQNALSSKTLWRF